MRCSILATDVSTLWLWWGGASPPARQPSSGGLNFDSAAQSGSALTVYNILSWCVYIHIYVFYYFLSFFQFFCSANTFASMFYFPICWSGFECVVCSVCRWGRVCIPELVAGCGGYWPSLPRPVQRSAQYLPPRPARRTAQSARRPGRDNSLPRHSVHRWKVDEQGRLNGDWGLSCFFISSAKWPEKTTF